MQSSVFSSFSTIFSFQSVRAVSPPRDKSMVHHGKSLISGEDRPINEDIINQAIASHQVQRNDTVSTPKSPSARLPPAKPAVKGAPSASTLLASLPQLGSYEDVIRSMEEAKQKKQEAIEVDRGEGEVASESAAVRRQRRKELQAKNAAILAAANEKLKIEDGDEERDPDAPPKPEAVTPVLKKPVGGKPSTDDEEPELAYQDLNLPPMDVWNGDLLLSAGANPSVLTNYFPLIARQIAGPPVLTLPLPSRIDEILRLKVDEVQKYVQLVVQRGSKKIVLVEMNLNTGGSTSSAKTSTMQEDFASFCTGYLKKNKALAFDFQKDPDPTNRLLLYLIPPDTQTHLTSEFVRKYLRASRPSGKMWGIFILPKETYAPIAKRISKLHLQKMQQQAKAVEKYNAMHAVPESPPVVQPVAAATTATPPAAVQTTRPQDPRKAAQLRAAEAVVATAATTSASSDTTQKAGATTTSESVSPPVPSTTFASTAAATPGLAALFKTTASLDAFSNMLSNLVAKTSGTSAVASAPASAPALAAFPPPSSSISAVAAPVGIPSFPPTPVTSLPMPPRALPLPPPPPPMHPTQQLGMPPPPQQMVNPQFSATPHPQQPHPHQQMGLPPPLYSHQLLPPTQQQQPPQYHPNAFHTTPQQPVQSGFSIMPSPQQLPPPQQQSFGPGRSLPPPPPPPPQQQPHPQMLPPPPPAGPPFPSMLGKHGRDEQQAGAPHDMQPPAQRSRFGPPMSAGGGPPQHSGPPPQGQMIHGLPMMQMPPPQQHLPPTTRVIPPGASGVCDFFFSSAGCRKGATCQFTHDIHNERAQEIMQQRGIPPHLAQAVQAMGGLKLHGQQAPPQQVLSTPPMNQSLQSPQRNSFAPPSQAQPQQRGLPPPPMMQMPPQQQQQQFNGPPPLQQHFTGPPQGQMQQPQYQPQYGSGGPPPQQSQRMLPPPPHQTQGLPPPNWIPNMPPPSHHHQQQQQQMSYQPNPQPPAHHQQFNPGMSQQGFPMRM